MKTCYDYAILFIQLGGVVVLIWYTIETFRMRKQNNEAAKAAEKRHLTSVRPIISFGSVSDSPQAPVSVIGENKFVIHNFGNGAAIDVEVLALTRGAVICSCFRHGFPYIGVHESRLVDNLTTGNIEDVENGILRKYGEKARAFFSSIEPLESVGNFPVCYLIALYRDIYGNNYVTQRDLFLNKSGHGGSPYEILSDVLSGM